MASEFTTDGKSGDLSGLPLKVGIPIDDVLRAVQAGEADPQDDRHWLVIEVNGDKQTLTAHGLNAQSAAGLLSWAWHYELHEIEKGAEHTH